MKLKHLLIISFILFPFLVINSQNNTSKQKENEKIQIFTSDERDNFQMWFYEEVNLMNMPNEKKDYYYSIILYYTSKMYRINDKDLGYTKNEIEEEFEILLNKQDKELKSLLTKKEYKEHHEIYDNLINSVRDRMDKTKY